MACVTVGVQNEGCTWRDALSAVGAHEDAVGRRSHRAVLRPRLPGQLYLRISTLFIDHGFPPFNRPREVLYRSQTGPAGRFRSTTPSYRTTLPPGHRPGRFRWSARILRMTATEKQAIDSQQPHRLQPVSRRSWADNNPGDLQQPHDRPGDQGLRTVAGYHLDIPRARS